MRYPRWSTVRPAIAVDARALIFVLSISTGAALIFGLIPALYAGRADVNDALKAGGRTSSPSLGGTRVWGLLVAGEVALASMLLIGAGRSGVGPTRAALRRGAARSGCHGARRPIAADGGDDRELPSGTAGDAHRSDGSAAPRISGALVPTDPPTGNHALSTLSTQTMIWEVRNKTSARIAGQASRARLGYEANPARRRLRHAGAHPARLAGGYCPGPARAVPLRIPAKPGPAEALELDRNRESHTGRRSE